MDRFNALFAENNVKVLKSLLAGFFAVIVISKDLVKYLGDKKEGITPSFFNFGTFFRAEVVCRKFCAVLKCNLQLNLNILI